jgi:hypothetical protein
MTEAIGIFIQPTHASFAEWIVDLEKIMDGWKEKHGEKPYGDGPLSMTTGLESWRDFYDDGYSPLDAFEEDRTNWD